MKKSGAATLLLALVLSLPARAALSAESNRLSFGLVPYNLTWYLGGHPTKNRTDDASTRVIGLEVAWARLFGRHFSIGPRLAAVHPLRFDSPYSTYRPDSLWDLRSTVVGRGILPLGEICELSLGAELGIALLSVDGYWGAGWTAGLLLGLGLGKGHWAGFVDLGAGFANAAVFAMTIGRVTAGVTRRW